MAKAITLESNPKDKDYEDYISAFFQAGGLYVERSIIHREEAEILELDIITTDFDGGDEPIRKLIEIKSAQWGFSEIFKVKGWLVYLNMSDGVFIVKNEREALNYFKVKASGLGVKLVVNSDLSKTGELLSEYLYQVPEEDEIETLRFSYLLERKLLKSIKNLKKENPDVESYKCLDDYFFKINSGTFFSNNPTRRIRQLFELFIKYKNITAKVCHELETGNYDDEIEELSGDGFKRIFYNAENSPMQIALYIEHLARITIIKSCTEYLLRKHRANFGEDNFLEKIDYLNIPQTIKSGLVNLVMEPYFHRYPIFWQFFTYIMGGFILTDLRDREYKYISDNTGIPIEHIPNAFDSFNKLFPKQSGWMFKIPRSNIEFHRFFPVPFCGIGANHRRFLYLRDLADDEDKTYVELQKLISGEKTMLDLYKWNGLAYEILK